jgi:hypothetical protein
VETFKVTKFEVIAVLVSIVIPFSGTVVGLVNVTTLPVVPPVIFNLDEAAVP